MRIKVATPVGISRLLAVQPNGFKASRNQIQYAMVFAAARRLNLGRSFMACEEAPMFPRPIGTDDGLREATEAAE